jgi:hypothetical protein
MASKNTVSRVDEQTHEVGFDKSPFSPGGLLAVRAGNAPGDAGRTASVIMGFLVDRHRQLVHTDNEPAADESYVHALLTDMAQALYQAAGADV